MQRDMEVKAYFPRGISFDISIFAGTNMSTWPQFQTKTSFESQIYRKDSASRCDWPDNPSITEMSAHKLGNNGHQQFRYANLLQCPASRGKNALGEFAMPLLIGEFNQADESLVLQCDLMTCHCNTKRTCGVISQSPTGRSQAN